MTDEPATGVPMGRFTSLGLGGPADYLAEAVAPGDLARWLHWAWARGLPWLVLGHGSNVVIADGGVRGLVVVNRRRLPIDDLVTEVADASSGRRVLRVDGGADLSGLALWAAGRGLSGIEWAAGIPGTVAGAVVGNAGAMGGSMADVVQAVAVVGPDGRPSEVRGDGLGFGYRTSTFRDGPAQWAIDSVDVVLALADREACEAAVAHNLAKRRAGQPAGRSAGCAFANPPGQHAGALLDRCGLKGARCGDAAVSERHANFVVNLGSACAADVISLMNAMRRAVHEQIGIVLEPEVRLLGDIGLEAL